MKTSKLFTVVASLAIFFGFLAIASAGTLEEIAQRGELRIAVSDPGRAFQFCG